MPDMESGIEDARKLSVTLARVLREFSRDYDRRLVQGIQARGHPDIRASHQVVFANIGLGRTRVTELAERARVTQQAMGKVLKELERLGYIERAVDEEDRRARAIRLTPRGTALMTDAVAAAREIDRFYASRIGEDAFRELDARLREAVARLELQHLPRAWSTSPRD